MTLSRRTSPGIVGQRTALSLEPLEQRLLLSSDPLSKSVVAVQGLPGTETSLTVSPEWFQTAPDVCTSGSNLEQYGTSQISWLGQTMEAVNGGWIVQFTDAAMAGISSVADTASLLPDRMSFQVLKGLGLAGQVLIHVSGSGPEAVAQWLSGDANVASFAPDAVMSLNSVPNDPLYTQLWGMNNTGQFLGKPGADIDAQSAWDLSTGSHSVVAAVIDTGVDYNHPDLAANMWHNPGEIPGNGIDDDGNGFVDDVYGWDFIDGDNDPMDLFGHGTHVAGTIGGVGNNGIGVAGVNWNVSIMALQIFDANGVTDAASPIAAVNYATMMLNRYNADNATGANVRVANASYGGYFFDAAERDSIAAYGAAGGLFVAAAGNDSNNNDGLLPHYPSSYDLPNIIAVAATDSSDRLASFSNYGHSTVDLGAPGVSILSTLPSGGSFLGQNYGFLDGTSMAAPQVTGVAALAWAYNPDATMEQVRDAILSGTDPVTSLAGKTVTGGRLNARATLERVMYPDPLHIQTQSATNASSTVTVYDLRGRVDVGPQDVQMAFGEGGVVKSLTIGGSGGGMGILISSVLSIGSIKDSRVSTEPLSVIAADAPIKSISVRNGLSGAQLNGLSLGGMVLPADIDGDGLTNDYTALYDVAPVQTVKVQGPVAGDVWISGKDAKGLSTKSFTTTGGDLYGDLRLGGGALAIGIGGSLEDMASVVLGGNSGSVSLSGALAGQLVVSDGSLSKLKVGTDLEGLVDVSGSLGSASVGREIVPGPNPLSLGGGEFLFGGIVRVLGTLGSLSVKGPAIDPWVLGGSIGSVTIGGNMNPVNFSSFILAGTNFGADWSFGGTGADADTFLPATLNSVTVKGSVADSVIGAGLSPAMGSLDLAAIKAAPSFLYGSAIRKLQIVGTFTGAPGPFGVGSYELDTVRIGRSPDPNNQFGFLWASGKNDPLCFFII